MNSLKGIPTKPIRKCSPITVVSWMHSNRSSNWWIFSARSFKVCLFGHKFGTLYNIFTGSKRIWNKIASDKRTNQSIFSACLRRRRFSRNCWHRQ